MQTVTLEGYVAADPSFRTSQSGNRIAQLRVLETTRFTKGDGGKGERTTGFNCVCFADTVVRNYLEPYAAKGSRIIVTGHVENDTWEDRDGRIHYDLKLVVDQVRLKNKREPANDDQPRREGGRFKPGISANGGSQRGPASTPRESFPADLDDEIPF